jgi:glycosyltransferase involved in cell wall biosynthesis
VIDIIIPGFNCRETLTSCLDSISSQTIAKQINVVFVDDCSDEGFEDILDGYRDVLNISYLRSDINRGPGYCRQLGLDNSKAQFVMFMDADDLFSGSDSIKTLYEEIRDEKDYVSSLVYSEVLDAVLDNAGDLHGKIYRRSFLKKRDISFSESRLHEDNLFNSLVLLNRPRMVSLDIVTCLYLNHSSSLSHSASLYSELSLRGYINNISVVKARFGDIVQEDGVVKDYFDAKYAYLKAIHSTADDNSKALISGLLSEYGLKPLE